MSFTEKDVTGTSLRSDLCSSLHVLFIANQTSVVYANIG